MNKKYKMMDKLELKLDEMEREAKQLKAEVADLICAYEVEDFLQNGPGGIDPKEL